MKLRNKKTGEIGELQITEKHCAVAVGNGTASCGKVIYNFLAELNAEWEDYEDELLYVVSAEHRSGYQCVLKEDYPEICEVAKELGIGFETEKECQKAVEKLKAWKRLKDKGFRFKCCDDYHIDYELTGRCAWTDETEKDLELLFGGEE